VILPSETRARVANGLALLSGKRQSVPPKKHGNIPL
jgi:propionyl-CoA carboxylase beta chain